MMGVAAFIVCGVTAFYTHRAAHGRTSEERFAYVVGEKAGEEAAAAGENLPTAAALNMIAQQYFARQGSGEPMAWKLAFEHGYEDGFKKAQGAP
jgi:hypothetical protein